MRSMFVGVTLTIAACSHAASQSSTCAIIAPAGPVSGIGAFSNVRYTEEHQYGETLLLWRSGDCVFGLLESAQGLQGDTPIGELKDVTYDPKSGALKFTARLSLGVILGPGATTQQPSRDLFTFAGKLEPTRVTGTLTHSTQLASPPDARSVVLTSSTTHAESMRDSPTYGEWRKKWDPILKARGPKEASVGPVGVGFWKTLSPEADTELDLTALKAHQALCQSTGADACLVIHHGRIVQEWYSASYRVPMYAMSSTKSVAGLLTGMLVDDKRIKGTSEPVCPFLATWCSGVRAKVTMGHVLSMTSGLPMMQDSSVGFVSDKNAYVEHLIPTSEPGTTWAYSTVCSGTSSPRSTATPRTDTWTLIFT